MCIAQSRFLNVGRRRVYDMIALWGEVTRGGWRSDSQFRQQMIRRIPLLMVLRYEKPLNTPSRWNYRRLSDFEQNVLQPASEVVDEPAYILVWLDVYSSTQVASEVSGSMVGE